MHRAAGGLAARLMCAGRDRRRALCRELPHTDRGGSRCGHSLNGDRFCSGGCQVHGGVLAHAQPGQMSQVGGGMSGCGHLCPDEPGELSGDGGDHGLAVGPSGVETTELAAQAGLRRPGPGDDSGVESLVAFGEDGAGGE